MLTKMMGNTGMCWDATGLYLTELGFTGLYWGGQVVQVIQVVGMISLDDMHSENLGFWWYKSSTIKLDVECKQN